MSLNELEMAVLRCEGAHPQTGPDKNEFIRQSVGISPARYYRVLEQLSRSQSALAVDSLALSRFQRRMQHLESQRGAWRANASGPLSQRVEGSHERRIYA